jgi:Flp pilus assembly protein TadG
MKRALRLLRDPSGATIIEFAFGFPILIVLIWMIYQFGLVFRANSGIQHALGEGARLATLWPTPAIDDVKTQMEQSVYGIGPGTFVVAEPEEEEEDGSTYLDLQVTYTQQTNMLLFPGPTINITKTKRVWVAGDAL